MGVSVSNRPTGVVILAVLAVIAALFAAIHALQSLAILPFFIGPFAVRGFSFFSFLMWALMVWVWIWLFQMLWNVDPQAWQFLAVVTVFNLVLDFTYILSSKVEFSDVSLSFIVNGLILIYMMLPGVRKAFGQK